MQLVLTFSLCVAQWSRRTCFCYCWCLQTLKSCKLVGVLHFVCQKSKSLTYFICIFLVCKMINH